MILAFRKNIRTRTYQYLPIIRTCSSIIFILCTVVCMMLSVYSMVDRNTYLQNKKKHIYTPSLPLEKIDKCDKLKPKGMHNLNRNSFLIAAFCYR